MDDILPLELESQGIDNKWKDKVIVYSWEDVQKDEFRNPKTYYIINAFNNYVYIAALKREKAQLISDTIYGKGHYIVKKVVKAIAR